MPKRTVPSPANRTHYDMIRTCFVIMPFGEKIDVRGKKVQFDAIYRSLLAPAIEAARLVAVRSDEVLESGLIHRKMLEHIRDARAAVVDISLLNANVFYELGVRHTLRRSVTVLVRRKGTAAPFNIAGLNVIEYDETDKANAAQASRRITEFLVNGMRGTGNDSLVHEVLDLNPAVVAKALPRQDVFSYRFRGRPTTVSLVTGGIQHLSDVDVWVNAENTNMQMARFYDWSVSSYIRYLGARRDQTGMVSPADDLIANQLNEIMGGKLSVPGGTVIMTTAGQLETTHHVKAIFHVACVEGQPGGGYRPVANLGDCVSNALQRMDSPDLRRPLSSIAFPLFGAGVSPRELFTIVRTLFDATVAYIDRTPGTAVRRICFLPWTSLELEACASQLEAYDELVPQFAELGLTRQRQKTRT